MSFRSLATLMIRRAAAPSAPVGAPLQPLAGKAQRRDASSKAYYGCAVYVSEARDAAVLHQLEHQARSAPGVCLANLFADEPYNRSNFTLVGASLPDLVAAVVGLARAALELVDLSQHAATHPRLGAVDHISCHPLPGATAAAGAGAASVGAAGAAAAVADDSGQVAPREQQQQQQLQQREATAALAQAIARELGCGALAVPVFMYGWASPQGRPLDAIRRELGYFQGAAAGSWQGSLQLAAAAAVAAVSSSSGSAGPTAHRALAYAASCDALPLPLAPCHGPAAAPARSGVSCVGATPWIVNYNVLLHTDDLAAARAVARAVSERGGGLAGVQAMALRHSEGVEVACNLLDPATTPPAAVLAEVQRLAAAAGLAVGPAYRTNKAPEELVAAAVAAGL